MDQASAKSALLGVVQQDNRHPPSSASGTALEQDAELATFGAALQQLVSQTAVTSAEASDRSDSPPEQARVTPSTTSVISRGIASAPFDNRQQHMRIVGPYELRCERLDNRQDKIVIDGPLTIYCTQLKEWSWRYHGDRPHQPAVY